MLVGSSKQLRIWVPRARTLPGVPNSSFDVSGKVKNSRSVRSSVMDPSFLLVRSGVEDCDQFPQFATGVGFQIERHGSLIHPNRVDGCARRRGARSCARRTLLAPQLAASKDVDSHRVAFAVAHVENLAVDLIDKSGQEFRQRPDMAGAQGLAKLFQSLAFRQPATGPIQSLFGVLCARGNRRTCKHAGRQEQHMSARNQGLRNGCRYSLFHSVTATIPNLPIR